MAIMQTMFPCCVSAWVATSKSVFMRLGELFLARTHKMGPFMLAEYDRDILPRILSFLVKRHVAYRCTICGRLMYGVEVDHLIRLKNRVSAQKVMYYCYTHQRAVLAGIPSFKRFPWRVVRRQQHLHKICNFFRVITKHRLGQFQRVSADCIKKSLDRHNDDL